MVASAGEKPRFRQDLVAEPIEDGQARFIDVADPDTGHPHRLPLPGGHGLRGRELGLGLLKIQRDVVETRRQRCAIELGDDVAFFDDRALGDDRRDLRLIDVHGLRLSRARDLDEFARAKLAGGRDDDLEVTMPDGSDEGSFGGRRGGGPLVPGRCADDQQQKRQGEPALTKRLHLESPRGWGRRSARNGDVASP